MPETDRLTSLSSSDFPLSHRVCAIEIERSTTETCSEDLSCHAFDLVGWGASYLQGSDAKRQEPLIGTASLSFTRQTFLSSYLPLSLMSCSSSPRGQASAVCSRMSRASLTLYGVAIVRKRQQHKPRQAFRDSVCPHYVVELEQELINLLVNLDWTKVR